MGFYLLLMLVICRYDDFMYYYKLNVIGITKFQYACLNLGGAGVLTLTVMAYNTFMREWETRTVVRLCFCIMVVNATANLIITMRWTEAMGISDIAFLAFTGTTFFPIIMALYIIPPFVLVAKITPAHVEATIFAFAASLINSGIHFATKYMGVAWNKLFFDVTTETLETDLWKLNLVEIGTAMAALFLTPLLPTWKEVRAQQSHMRDVNKSEYTSAINKLQYSDDFDSEGDDDAFFGTEGNKINSDVQREESRQLRAQLKLARARSTLSQASSDKQA